MRNNGIRVEYMTKSGTREKPTKGIMGGSESERGNRRSSRKSESGSEVGRGCQGSIGILGSNSASLTMLLFCSRKSKTVRSLPFFFGMQSIGTA